MVEPWLRYWSGLLWSEHTDGKSSWKKRHTAGWIPNRLSQHAVIIQWSLLSQWDYHTVITVRCCDNCPQKMPVLHVFASTCTYTYTSLHRSNSTIAYDCFWLHGCLKLKTTGGPGDCLVSAFIDHNCFNSAVAFQIQRLRARWTSRWNLSGQFDDQHAFFLDFWNCCWVRLCYTTGVCSRRFRIARTEPKRTDPKLSPRPLRNWPRSSGRRSFLTTKHHDSSSGLLQHDPQQRYIMELNFTTSCEGMNSTESCSKIHVCCN